MDSYDEVEIGEEFKTNIKIQIPKNHSEQQGSKLEF